MTATQCSAGDAPSCEARCDHFTCVQHRIVNPCDSTQESSQHVIRHLVIPVGA